MPEIQTLMVGATRAETRIRTDLQKEVDDLCSLDVNDGKVKIKYNHTPSIEVSWTSINIR